MAIMRITCPECGAGLKSPDGFTVGQEVECPKCSTEFEVEKPVAAKTTALAPSQTKALSKKTTKLSARDDEDDDDLPKKKKGKKKKKAADDEEEWSYKNSWIRYAVLGVLLIVMCVLGYMLYLKQKRAKESGEAKPGEGGNAPVVVEPAGGGSKQGGRLNQGGPNPFQKGPQMNFTVPPSGQPGLTPVGGGGVPLGVVPKGGVVNAPSPGPLALLDSPALSPQQQEQKKKELSAKLLGTWTADLGGGKIVSVTYTPDGNFTESGAQSKTGTWRVSELLGTRGLVLARSVEPREVTAVFEGTEMIHDTAERGVSGVFRKK